MFCAAVAQSGIPHSYRSSVLGMVHHDKGNRSTNDRSGNARLQVRIWCCPKTCVLQLGQSMKRGAGAGLTKNECFASGPGLGMIVTCGSS